jgi:hypothetical protein
MHGTQVQRALRKVNINRKLHTSEHGDYMEKQVSHRPPVLPTILIRSGCTVGPEPPLGGAALAFPDAGTKAGGGPLVEPPGGGNPPPGGGNPPGGKGGIAPAGARDAHT